eukprot:1162142-Pelagomonas_calceolata.AAC.17
MHECITQELCLQCCTGKDRRGHQSIASLALAGSLASTVTNAWMAVKIQTRKVKTVTVGHCSRKLQWTSPRLELEVQVRL